MCLLYNVISCLLPTAAASCSNCRVLWLTGEEEGRSREEISPPEEIGAQIGSHAAAGGGVDAGPVASVAGVDRGGGGRRSCTRSRTPQPPGSALARAARRSLDNAVARPHFGSPRPASCPPPIAAGVAGVGSRVVGSRLVAPQT